MGYAILNSASLTAYSGRLLKGSSHLWVHLNCVVAFYKDFMISCLNLCLDPVAEDIAEDGEGNVSEEILRQPCNFLNIWQPISHLLVLCEEAADLFHSKPVILRNCYSLDAIVLDFSLLTVNKVLTEVNRNSLVGWHINVRVDLQELYRNNGLVTRRPHLVLTMNTSRLLFIFAATVLTLRFTL